MQTGFVDDIHMWFLIRHSSLVSQHPKNHKIALFTRLIQIKRKRKRIPIKYNNEVVVIAFSYKINLPVFLSRRTVIYMPLISSRMMMRSLILLSQLFFYLLLLLYSQLTSSSSSAPLCSQDQSFALLQFKQLFSFSNDVSFNCDEAGLHSYTRMESWKEGTDCCSWDGVTCDRMKGDVIGLDLSCSWLNGTIPFNSSLFLLPHLQWLNLASNNFNYSSISSRFGQFARLKHLDLSHSMFSGKVPLEISHLSQLASLDLSDYNSYLKLEASVVKRLVQNLTKLRELHLENVEMSSISLSSFMNLSSALTSITLNNCLLRGKLPDHIFRLPNLC